MKNLTKTIRSIILTAATTTCMVGTTSAADFTLRIQTHHAPGSLPGRVFTQFVDDVETMSAGRLEVNAFTSSAVVKASETFEAAKNGLLDGDMTNPTYITGKNPAFQFVGDVMGGYERPEQMQGWLAVGGGKTIVDELYSSYGMHLVGLWGQGPESLSSMRELDTVAKLHDWKFRSPPGMESEIFIKLGAKPVVMDFGEVFSAMNTGVVDGADASTLNTNQSLGLYDVAKYATYPGWHSMPADHLAINQKKWDSLPKDIQRIIEVALKKAATDLEQNSVVENAKSADILRKSGITLSNWSQEDKKIFRSAAQSVWESWAKKNEITGRLVDSHISYMKMIGLL